MAALASWADVVHVQGTWLVRMEDIDPPREQPGAPAAILDTLLELGLHTAEPVLFQSTRSAVYEDCLERLLRNGAAFECRCSRTDLLGSGGIHRGACAAGVHGAPAVRLRVPSGRVRFVDRIQGPQVQDLEDAVGDFVLRRRDGLFAYQLAVVIDDAAQEITDVVRGSDLLDSTPRQICLQRVLGLPTPRYAHIPVAVDASGAKLSKQNLAPAVDARSALATLGHAARLLGQSVPPGELDISRWLQAFADGWRIDKVPRAPSVPAAELLTE